MPPSPDRTSGDSQVTYGSWNGEIFSTGTEPPYTAPSGLGTRLINVNGQVVSKADYAKNPGPVNKTFGWDSNQTTTAAFSDALAHARSYTQIRNPDGSWTDKPIGDRLTGMAQLLYDLDNYSLLQYLVDIAGWDTPQIQAVGTLENLTSRLSYGFLHSVFDATDINPSVTYFEFSDGTDALTTALAKGLPIEQDRAVIRVESSGGKVTVIAEPESGPEDEACDGEIGGSQFRYEADAVVFAMPYAALRHVQFAPLLPYGKRRAINELTHDTAHKVLIEFTERWWEWDEATWRDKLGSDYRTAPHGRPYPRSAAAASPTRPTGSSTSLPPQPRRSPRRRGPGRLQLVRGRPAVRLVDPQDRHREVLDHLVSLYGERIRRYATDRAVSQSWLRNRWALGEAVIETPGQLLSLGPHVAEPVGNALYFAGDQCQPRYHAWISGAIASGCEAALQVADRA